MLGRSINLLDEYVAVVAVLEVLSIPAWIWIYNEIKRQTPYESIPPQQEEQPITNSSNSRSRVSSSSSDEGISA